MELIGLPGTAEWVLIVIFLIPVLVLPIVALVDIIRSPFHGSKVPWVLLVLFLGFAGAVIYFIVGVTQKTKE